MESSAPGDVPGPSHATKRGEVVDRLAGGDSSSSVGKSLGARRSEDRIRGGARAEERSDAAIPPARSENRVKAPRVYKRLTRAAAAAAAAAKTAAETARTVEGMPVGPTPLTRSEISGNNSGISGTDSGISGTLPAAVPATAPETTTRRPDNVRRRPGPGNAPLLGSCLVLGARRYLLPFRAMLLPDGAPSRSKALRVVSVLRPGTRAGKAEDFRERRLTLRGKAAFGKGPGGSAPQEKIPEKSAPGKVCVPGKSPAEEVGRRPEKFFVKFAEKFLERPSPGNPSVPEKPQRDEAGRCPEKFFVKFAEKFLGKSAPGADPSDKFAGRSRAEESRGEISLREPERDSQRERRRQIVSPPECDWEFSRESHWKFSRVGGGGGGRGERRVGGRETSHGGAAHGEVKVEEVVEEVKVEQDLLLDVVEEEVKEEVAVERDAVTALDQAEDVVMVVDDEADDDEEEDVKARRFRRAQPITLSDDDEVEEVKVDAVRKVEQLVGDVKEVKLEEVGDIAGHLNIVQVEIRGKVEQRGDGGGRGGGGGVNGCGGGGGRWNERGGGGARVPLPGAPLPGTPLPGTPSPGTPSPGTPLPGAPLPGTPSPGTPSPGTPLPRVAEIEVELRDDDDDEVHDDDYKDDRDEDDDDDDDEGDLSEEEPRGCRTPVLPSPTMPVFPSPPLWNPFIFPGDEDLPERRCFDCGEEIPAASTAAGAGDPPEGRSCDSCRLDGAALQAATNGERRRGPRHVCGRCGRDFSAAARLLRHSASHSAPAADSAAAYACWVCRASFPRAALLKRHVPTHGGPGGAGGPGGPAPHSCLACGRAFARLRGLRRHALSHAAQPSCGGPKPLACAMCGKRYAASAYLRRHVAMHAGRDAYRCAKCPRRFDSAGLLGEHVRAHVVK